MQAKLSPLLECVYESREELDVQIKQVAKLIVDTAQERLSAVQQTSVQMKGYILSRLCCQSQAAWRAWKEARSPRDRLLFEQKNRLRREVRTLVNYCSAMAERRRVQGREMLFHSQDSSRFRVPWKQRSRWSKFRADGRLLLDPEDLLTAWSSHFRMLSESKKDIPKLSELESRVEEMAAGLFANEEAILNCLLIREEVAGALRKLKVMKAADPDGTVGEHLKRGGAVVQEWLLRVLNAVVDIEVVPSVLKSGIIVPVYKGGGKDPRISSGVGVAIPYVREAA